MQATANISALFADESFVIGKCDFLVDVQLWPITKTMKPRRWLDNFLPDERPYAVQLLNAFTYYSRTATNELFLRGFQALSRRLRSPNDSLLAVKQKWKHFLSNAIITCARGEEPHPVDSGLTFLRMARQVAGMPEEQIMEPSAALEALCQNPTRPLIFLDDFVGSGNQFITTWNAPSVSIGGTKLSFSRISTLLRTTSFYYCPLVCTEYGVNKISKACKRVIVAPTHTIGEEYSVVSPRSKMWPESKKAEAIEVVHRASLRAGIPEEDWMGFHDLGLAFAFEHSVPDATLPLFHFSSEHWTPLIERV